MSERLLTEVRPRRVLVDETTQVKYRVLYVKPVDNVVYLIDINPENKRAFPEKNRLSALLERMGGDEPEVQFLPFADKPGQQKAPTAAQTKRRDAAWEALQRLLAAGVPQVFKRSTYAAAVKQAVRDRVGADSYLRRIFREYLQGGMVPNALLGNFSRCGKGSSGGRRGAKPRFAEPSQCVLTDDDLVEIRALMESFKKGQLSSIAAVYRTLLVRRYSFQDEKGFLHSVPDQPTERQVRYAIRRAVKREVILSHFARVYATET